MCEGSSNRFKNTKGSIIIWGVCLSIYAKIFGIIMGNTVQPLIADKQLHLL